MNFVQIVATLRKFGNYLAGLFPVLAVILNFLSKQLSKFVNSPALAPLWQRLSTNPQARSIWKFFERFFWRTYAKDRLDLSQAPPETVALLRPIFQLCAALCVLIPLTQYSFASVDIEAFSGFKSNAPVWSVTLWLVSLPCAWAAILVGTAISNRVAFALTACAAATSLITCVVLLPRDFSNALAPLSILIALGYCERTLKTESTSKFLSVLNAVIVGIAAGIPLVILTPIRPYLGTLTTLPGPVVSIGSGAIIGTILGLSVLAWARMPHVAERPPMFRGAPMNMGAVVWTIAILLAGYLVAGVARGSLGQSGSMLISSLYLTNSYLWPMWYFIGVGILHKLLGSSKVVASSVEGFLPPKLLSPLLVLILLASTLIAYVDRLAFSLSFMRNPVADTLLPYAFQIFLFTKPAIWSNPYNAMTVHWFSWVLLFDCLVVGLLAIQKRLTSAALLRLFFLSSFALLLIWEYVLQMSSFTRAPSHSVLALFLFAIWLLWLMHTVGWSLSSKSSPCWPASGRLAVYSGIALIAILDIHARSASRDFRVMNELFMEMFRGVIDVGLPYYFLVWTSKKVEDLPVKISTLLGIFSLGAVTSFVFNIFEKLAGARWNVSQMLQLIESHRVLLESTGSPNIELDLPTSFFIIRSINYVALLVLVYAVARKRTAATAGGSRTSLFVLVAYASGIAAFSNTLVMLPVPPELRAAIAPCTQELLFSCNLLQSYLSYWIPALMLGISQLNSKLRNVLLVIPFAMAAHGLISWGYADFGVYLRSSGCLYTVITALAGVFVLLVTVALQKISPAHSEADESNKEPNNTKSRATLLTPRAVIILVVILELILAPIIIVKCQNKRFESRQFPVFDHPVSLASTWKEIPFKGTNASAVTLTRTAPSGGPSILQVGTVPSNPKGTNELLQTLLTAAAQSGNFPNLNVLTVSPWTQYHAHALSCQFSYDRKGTQGVVSGLSVLIPGRDGKTEFYTLHTNPGDIENEQFELAFTVKQLRDSHR
ncbi:MAG: hypothetical protein SGJ27_11620 [Candidatus Melainabacteria bacterium]|mgnify:CR=1 FL=1|nr:hypothetical protein [Candidatus Melainabacteria bacterium]